MPELNVPDSMPVLSQGNHKSPAEGACVMEYISLVKGEPFSDFPRCTEPMVANAAQGVNDRILNDADRSEVLLPRLERIMNAAPLDDHFPWDDPSRMTKSLAVADRCAFYGLPFDGPWVGSSYIPPVWALEAWLDRVLDLYDRAAKAFGVAPACPVSVTLTEDTVLIEA